MGSVETSPRIALWEKSRGQAQSVSGIPSAFYSYDICVLDDGPVAEQFAKLLLAASSNVYRGPG
jgi:hypothetical protein